MAFLDDIRNSFNSVGYNIGHALGSVVKGTQNAGYSAGYAVGDTAGGIVKDTSTIGGKAVEGLKGATKVVTNALSDVEKNIRIIVYVGIALFIVYIIGGLRR